MNITIILYTETAIFSPSTILFRSIDDGKVSVLVLFDLSAAFDTVDHDILLSLLSRRLPVLQQRYSTRLVPIIFVMPYPIVQLCWPSDRTVSIGPLKFIAYTENGMDTIKQHNVNVHLYADDKQLYVCCYPQSTQHSRHSSSHILLHGCFLDIMCISSTAAKR